jgi:hypothetical protein
MCTPLLKHNPKYGDEYEQSEVMTKYINCVENHMSLKRGCPVFNGISLLGDEFDKKLDQWYDHCVNTMTQSPNTMHKFGSNGSLTTQDLANLMMTLRPFINEYFGEKYCDKLALYQQFSVHYSVITDKKLDKHVDDSDITINICLKNTFGFGSSTIHFDDSPDTLFSKSENKPFGISLSRGDIMIHKGNHAHYVTDIGNNKTGERCNLILWLKYC